MGLILWDGRVRPSRARANERSEFVSELLTERWPTRVRYG